MRALVDYAVKLTRLETLMRPEDLEPLRRAGLSDAEIRDAAQVIGYMNYVNRQVEGLGVDLEPDYPGRRWGELAVPEKAGR
jgi:alkylhydroperoxidase family enzyme